MHKTYMKLFLFVLILIFNLSLHAQKKDSTFCHYGFVMDYQDEMINQIGFKYRQSETIAYFLRGNLFSQKPWMYSEGNETHQELRKYGGILGIEYGIHSTNNTTFYIVASAGLIVTDFSQVYFLEGTYYEYAGKLYDKNFTYSIASGVGAEYFFSNHLSIGCCQMLSLNYSSGNRISDYGESDPFTYTKVVFGNTKFTLSFYF